MDKQLKQPVVCVFCGSSDGETSSDGKSYPHKEAARAFGEMLHQHGYKLVYGASRNGVMGEVAKTIVELSGPDAVHGIVPKPLIKMEAGRGSSDATWGRLTVVNSMHERKELMAKEVMNGGPGSGFVALSGGFGTIEEIMEAATWNQLNIHKLPAVLFNLDGFWDPIMTWITVTAVKEKFIKPENSEIVQSASSPTGVIEKLQNYKLSPKRMTLNWDQVFSRASNSSDAIQYVSIAGAVIVAFATGVAVAKRGYI